MLQLHSTFRKLLFAIFPLFIILISCSDRSKTDLEVIKALNESIESSNKMLSVSTVEVMTMLKNKLYEPSMVERAKVWYPRAEKVQQLSTDVYDYIKHVKQNIYDSVLNISELFIKLKNYKEDLLQVDSRITHQFEASLKVFTQLVDTSKLDQEKIFHEYFNSISIESTIAMLSKLQNNIKFNEMRVVTFCNENVGVTADYWPVFQSIAILNTTLAQPKESLELTAGMLSFQKKPKSEVFIYHKKRELINDGFAHFKFRASEKVGKYHVPVRIDYTDFDGIRKSMNIQVEYTVVNIQKQ